MSAEWLSLVVPLVGLTGLCILVRPVSPAKGSASAQTDRHSPFHRRHVRMHPHQQQAKPPAS